MTTTVSAAGATQRFYRVVVQDVDSDGDGVTDWEELALGYDPNSSHSSGVNGTDDFASITHALQAPNVVTISAIEPAAAEAGVKPGAFLITRSGNLNAIKVRYTVGGGATPGTDYVALSGEVNLGVGVNSATVTVTPIADTVLESNEAVIVTLKTDAAYNLGSPATATVLISDDIVPNQADKGGLFAQFWNEASSGATAPSATVPPSHPGTPFRESMPRSTMIGRITRPRGVVRRTPPSTPTISQADGQGKCFLSTPRFIPSSST